MEWKNVDNLFTLKRTAEIGYEIETILKSIKSDIYKVDECINGADYYFYFTNDFYFYISCNRRNQTYIGFGYLYNPNFDFFIGTDLSCTYDPERYDAITLEEYKNIYVAMQYRNQLYYTIKHIVTESEEQAQEYMNFIRYILILLDSHLILRKLYLRLVKYKDNILIDRRIEEDKISTFIKKINNF